MDEVTNESVEEEVCEVAEDDSADEVEE